jgi:RHS repeat-associated protein
MHWELVAVIEGGVISFVRADHIGRPVFATNASGAKVWTATYLPFGGVHVSTGTLPNARFPSQWFQSESGLHQNWMRDYDPTTGRYLQADPLGLVDGASVYGYVKQNPGRWIDPMGLFSLDDLFGGGGDGGGSGPVCLEPDKCVLYRAYDGAFLRFIGWGYPPGKLCIYTCPGFAGPAKYGKREYSFKWGHCPATLFQFELQPLDARDLSLVGPLP